MCISISNTVPDAGLEPTEGNAAAQRAALASRCPQPTWSSVSLGYLCYQIAEGTLVLDPPYARECAWTTRQQSMLVESVLRGQLIPSILVWEQEDGAYWIVDGKQRLLAVNGFVSGALCLTLGKGNIFDGTAFRDLGPKAQRAVRNCVLEMAVMSPRATEQSAVEAYLRLNT